MWRTPGITFHHFVMIFNIGELGYVISIYGITFHHVCNCSGDIRRMVAIITTQYAMKKLNTTIKTPWYPGIWKKRLGNWYPRFKYIVVMSSVYLLNVHVILFCLCLGYSDKIAIIFWQQFNYLLCPIITHLFRKRTINFQTEKKIFFLFSVNFYILIVIAML